jgi:pimeloyl-ACP methyl ester carboxylesterase
LDTSYWNFGNSTYNWITAASAAGYSTFSYDRLGTGDSPKVDPYNTLQSTVELAILIKLTEMLKAGALSPKIAKPSKIVHVGHSYGSSLSNGLVGTRPDLSDGVIFTGYSHNASFLPMFQINTGYHLAVENSPRFAGFSTGYLTWPDVYANQFSEFIRVLPYDIL